MIMNNILEKTLALSLLLSPLLLAEAIEMEEVQIQETVNTVIINDISGEELKSADLADSLTRTVPSVSLVRRSGISNDIILRGQKKDNINITVDGAKIYGAGPNRMDPPTSHILTNNIESIEIKEGPYDVEHFGTLSGLVDVKTRKPSEEVSGEVNLNAGSFNQKKASATVNGGYKNFRMLLSASTESSDQYKDGNGRTLSQQVDEYISQNTGSNAGNAYLPQYKEMKAYEKKAFMGKIYFNPTDNQELRFSYTANRSDDILYPSTPMDANRDDSDIFNLEYSITEMGSLSKKLDLQYYNSSVDHPMSNTYRVSSNMIGLRFNNMKSKIEGAKLTNLFEAAETDVTFGLDMSKRNWSGYYTNNGNFSGNSIDDTDTKNIGLFSKLERSFAALDLDLGLRYDDTSIETAGANQKRDYSALNGYLFATLNADHGMKYFIGAGKSARVPDARELYFKGMMGNIVGTPDLEQTKNYEIDLGLKKQYDNAFVKVKLFHSWLTDYVTYNDSKRSMMNMPVNAFENVDAKIYGMEISGFYAMNDAAYLDFGAAYQRGKKDTALARQTDRDLAEIPPLKVNMALNYDTELTGSKLELIAADNWRNFDSDNGEQAIAGYAVVNLRWNRDLSNGLDITLGMDNVFDHAYAVSNTYKDLTLLSSTGGDEEVMLLNEPGRYIYANLRYRF